MKAVGTDAYRVSVVIPAYNCEKYIKRCLDSLSFQDFEGGFEIILVDDGSTDHTRIVCDSLLSKQDIPYKLIRQPGLGASAARNSGIRAAEGEFLLFADGDDTLEPHALRTLYGIACANQADMACGCFKKVDRNGRLLWRHRPGKNTCGVMSPDEMIHAVFMGEMLIRLGAFIIRKSCLLRHDTRFNESFRFGEDMEFIIRCLLSVDKTCRTRAFVYSYYENDGSVMSKAGCERFEFAEALDSLRSRASGDDLSRFIAYGVLFHIDKLLAGGVPAREIMSFLSEKNIDRFLKTARSSGSKSLSRKAARWMDKPEAYRKRLLFVQKMKWPAHQTARMLLRLKSVLDPAEI